MSDAKIDVVCCSFCGKTQAEVRKLIAGPTVYICDECVDLAQDIIADEIDLEATAVQTLSLTREIRAGEYLMHPVVVTRYTSEPVATVSRSEMPASNWICEGCGWRLTLARDATPPAEHSEEIVLSQWPEAPGKIPPREQVPKCSEPSWRKLF